MLLSCVTLHHYVMLLSCVTSLRVVKLCYVTSLRCVVKLCYITSLRYVVKLCYVTSLFWRPYVHHIPFYSLHHFSLSWFCGSQKLQGKTRFLWSRGCGNHLLLATGEDHFKLCLSGSRTLGRSEPCGNFRKDTMSLNVDSVVSCVTLIKLNTNFTNFFSQTLS